MAYTMNRVLRNIFPYPAHTSIQSANPNKSDTPSLGSNYLYILLKIKMSLPMR